MQYHIRAEARAPQVGFPIQSGGDERRRFSLCKAEGHGSVKPGWNATSASLRFPHDTMQWGALELSCYHLKESCALINQLINNQGGCPRHLFRQYEVLFRKTLLSASWGTDEVILHPTLLELKDFQEAIALNVQGKWISVVCKQVSCYFRTQ